MSIDEFEQLIGRISADLADRPANADTEAFLNRTYGAETTDFKQLKRLCRDGEAEGWLMARQAGGIKFGRAIKPGDAAGDFSVDVVRMKDVRGPHHVHTTGEIGAIMPIEGEPRFDGRPEGWYVYEPGSQHHPTVEGGDAHILYLLPGGQIEFTGK